jgi:hypothetical protein
VGILSLDLNHIPEEKHLVYSSTLMAYYNYLVLVGAPAHMHSWYIHTHLMLYLKDEKKRVCFQHPGRLYRWLDHGDFWEPPNCENFNFDYQ